MPPADPFTSVRVSEIAFEAFGVRVGVGANDPRAGARLAELVPPNSRRCAVDAVDHHFAVHSDDGSTFTVRYDVEDGRPVGILEASSYIATDVDLPLALGLLDINLHDCIANRAPDRVFIHGGAVAHLDRMIVMPGGVPGQALTGRSTLVAALIRAGATYYSDRFAVLDERGRVHPYATPLRVPGADRPAPDQNGDQQGLAGKAPLPVGAIVLTSYRPGAEWRPRRLSHGESVLALMSNAVPAQERPEQSMRVIRCVLEAEPLVIESDRDEAGPLASSLLADLERQFAASA